MDDKTILAINRERTTLQKKRKAFSILILTINHYIYRWSRIKTGYVHTSNY